MHQPFRVGALTVPRRAADTTQAEASGSSPWAGDREAAIDRSEPAGAPAAGASDHGGAGNPGIDPPVAAGMPRRGWRTVVVTDAATGRPIASRLLGPGDPRAAQPFASWFGGNR